MRLNRNITRLPTQDLQIDVDALNRDPDLAATATALWAAENDRQIALASKGAGALAVDALLAGALVQASALSRPSALLCLGAAVFVTTSAIAASLTQMPRQRSSPSPQGIADGGGAADMLHATKLNQPLGHILNNLTWASITDALRALALTVAALTVGILTRLT